ncbi:unnamed protein product [Prunus armeniaca]
MLKALHEILVIQEEEEIIVIKEEEEEHVEEEENKVSPFPIFSATIASTAKEGKVRAGKWYLDSGCSNHMTGNKSAFVNFKHTNNSEVRIGDGGKLVAKGCEDILFLSKSGEQKRISNVLYVPDLNYNLLSMGNFFVKAIIFISRKTNV